MWTSDGENPGSPVAELRRVHPTILSPSAPRIRHSATFLASNDDNLERARSRAARTAASRRRSAVLVASPPSSDLLDRDRVLDLLHNCIKLASENKINQRNTWDLGLIDHLSELIRVDAKDDDCETNFQKASCTLEAGVKIYSLRVDSAHSEAYKVLGGIMRVGREEDKENISEDAHNNGAEKEGVPKKEQLRKLSPLSTLESSFETLNVKKFDVAFTVDPLYHQTSAQFDEGGAKGLLLSNLGVYGACKVLFDSLETPGKNMGCESAPDKTEFIDLSFARDQLQQMINCVPMKKEISPTLKDIIELFNEDNRRPANVLPEPMQTAEQDDVFDTNESMYDADVPGPWNDDNDDNASMVGDESSYMNFDLVGNQDVCAEENEDHSFPQAAADDRFEKIAGFLSLGLGLTSKVNAWAGPDHWKYQKARGAKPNPDTSSETKAAMPKKSKKQDASDFEFSKLLDVDMPDVFLPPKNPKTLLLSANRAPINITLPEDCHYQPESLIKLFLLPNVLCFGKKTRSSDKQTVQNDSFDSMEDWDNESTVNDHFNDGNSHSDHDDLGDLVSQPRQILKLDIKYDKFSKQVDVHALKGALWDQIVESADKLETGCKSSVSFKQVFGCLRNNSAASSHEDLSPHLSLICLLHLANEHCLRICDCPTLDELDIYVPLPPASRN